MLLYLKAIRVHTLFFPLMTATLWAISSPPIYNSLTFWLFTFHFFLIQAGVNLWNTYEDYVEGVDHEERFNMQHIIQKYGVSAPTVLKWFLVTYTLSFLIALYVLPSQNIILCLGLTLLALITGVLYSGVKGWALSHYALGEVLAFFAFGPVVIFYYDSYLQIFHSLTDILHLGVGIGLWAVALMTANNLRDQKPDKKVDKITIPILFGEKSGLIIFYACFVGIAIWGYTLHQFVLLSSAPIALLISFAYMKFSKGEVPLNQLLVKTGKMAWIQTFALLTFYIGEFLR